MKTIYTIKNFAKRLVMAIAAILMVSNAWGVNWNKITNLSDLSNGDSVLVVLQIGNTLTAGKAVSVNGTTTANSADVTITSNSYISNPANTIKWAITNSSGSNYIIKSGSYYLSSGSNSSSNHNIASNITTSNSWYITKVSDGYFKLQFENSSGQYLSWKSTCYGKYATSNFRNQISTVTALDQYDGAISFYKKEAAASYAVTYNNGGHGTAPSSTTASNVTLSAITATGWTCTGWKANVNVTNTSTSATITAGTLIANGTNVTLSAATTFTAQWTAKTTTVSFNQNGGEGGQTTSKTATYGQAMPTPITLPTRTHYTFGGYYDGAGGTGTQYYTNTGASARNWDKTSATTTLYAKWTENALTNYRTTCCTDWSTPTVTYSSSLAINSSEGVTIGSGTTHGAVTYESSDEDVLTVDADGTIHAVGAGTAHIIATWAGETISSTTYCEKSANSNDVTVSGIQVTGSTPVNFGQVYQNAVLADKTIYVTGLGLESAITPSLPAGSPFGFSPASLAANSSGATLTISANTATIGSYNQTLTLTSGSFSTTVTVKMEVIAMPSCEFVDNLHNLTVDASSVPLSSYALTAAQGTAVVFPTLANQVKGASTCEDQHYRFVGWTTSDNNTDPEDHLVTSHTLANGDDITYYAVWADGVAGVSYTRLTSSTFKTSPTTYVIGAEYSSSTYYFYSCTETDANNSWGVCSTDPSTDAPIQFTLSGSASALVATSTEGTARYLNPASGKQFFGMSATSKTVVLGASGTIESSAASYNLLRYNYNSGSGGLRWYSSDTGEPAYFYEVVAGSTPSYRTSCCANKVEAPTVIATKTSTSITLTWDDETGATGWEVSWNGGAFGSPSGTRTHTVSGLTPNTTYTWQVRATYTTPQCGADIASGSTTTNQVYHVTYATGDGEANCNATGSTADATGYEAGATVTLQANGFTLVGHTFAGWTEDDDDIMISSNQFTMPDHDVVITASWTAKVDKYFDRMHDQTDALHGGVEETEGTNEGKYYIPKEGCNYSIPTAVDSNTGDACQTSHYKLQGWIAASYVASDGTITPANLAAHLFPPTGTKTATGATYYAVWAEVTE